MMEQVLFVDDEGDIRKAAAQTFDLADLNATCLKDAQSALKQVNRDFPGVVATDIRMKGMDGVELLRRLLEIDPEFPVIMISGNADIELAVDCMKYGAYDFIEKPFEPNDLVDCVKRGLEKRRLTLENRTLRQQTKNTDAIDEMLVGRSVAMVGFRNTVRAIANTDVDVLITGETGSGKEVAARAIHNVSQRANGAFVHINCAALPDAMVESELFGHEAGAFPGATRARFGKLEAARGGILCLDEIDSLGLSMQAKRLDALHNRTVTRLGSNEPVALDMRVIALSKTNLEQRVADGSFRADLLYRLNVVTLNVPSLCERQDDIPSLFSRLTFEAAARYDRRLPDVHAGLLNELASRQWPGNIRELRNAADRFVLGLDYRENPDGLVPDTTLSVLMAEQEKALIAASISANAGSLKDTYTALGLSRKTLYEKMQRHGIDRKDFIDPD